MKKLHTISTMLLLLATLFVFSCTVVIKGTISVKGNEPHTYCALVTDENKEYKIIGKFQKEIQDTYQGSRLTLKGTVIRQHRGPGFPAELMVDEIIQSE